MSADKSGNAIKEAAAKIAEKVAKNCGSVPQLTFPHIYLGLEEFAAAFEAAPQQAQAPKTVCMDQFCACRGGTCASCEEGEREAELASLRSSLEFYKRRCDLLQQLQSKMRDPERVLVCDILANGQTLPESTGRYALPEAQQAQAPGWQPIATAPEDLDRPVVVFWRNAEGEEQRCLDYTEDGCWMEWHNHAEHVEIIGGHGVSYTPPYTHWLPNVPAPQQGSKS